MTLADTVVQTRMQHMQKTTTCMSLRRPATTTLGMLGEAVLEMGVAQHTSRTTLVGTPLLMHLILSRQPSLGLTSFRSVVLHDGFC